MSVAVTQNLTSQHATMGQTRNLVFTTQEATKVFLNLSFVFLSRAIKATEREVWLKGFNSYYSLLPWKSAEPFQVCRSSIFGQFFQ